LTESAVSASLAAVNQAVNQEQIEKLLTSDAVVKSTRKLTREVTAAAAAELDSPERQARAKELAADFVRDLGPALGAMLDKDILPRVESTLTASVQKLVDDALSEAGRKRAGAFVAGVAKDAMAAVGPPLQKAIASGVSAGIERSVRSVLAQDLGPALGKALDANAPALSQATRAATTGALAGVTDAMKGPFGKMLAEEIDTERRKSFEEAKRFSDAERDVWLAEIHHWFRAFLVIAIVAGVLCLGFGIMVLRLLLENRRLRTGT
jgi:hypothetical protein